MPTFAPCWPQITQASTPVNPVLAIIPRINEVHVAQGPVPPSNVSWLEMKVSIPSDMCLMMVPLSMQSNPGTSIVPVQFLQQEAIPATSNFVSTSLPAASGPPMDVDQFTLGLIESLQHFAHQSTELGGAANAYEAQVPPSTIPCVPSQAPKPRKRRRSSVDSGAAKKHKKCTRNQFLVLRNAYSKCLQDLNPKLKAETISRIAGRLWKSMTKYEISLYKIMSVFYKQRQQEQGLDTAGNIEEDLGLSDSRRSSICAYPGLHDLTAAPASSNPAAGAVSAALAQPSIPAIGPENQVPNPVHSEQHVTIVNDNLQRATVTPVSLMSEPPQTSMAAIVSAMLLQPSETLGLEAPTWKAPNPVLLAQYLLNDNKRCFFPDTKTAITAAERREEYKSLSHEAGVPLFGNIQVLIAALGDLTSAEYKEFYMRTCSGQDRSQLQALQDAVVPLVQSGTVPTMPPTMATNPMFLGSTFAQPNYSVFAAGSGLSGGGGGGG